MDQSLLLQKQIFDRPLTQKISFSSFAARRFSAVFTRSWHWTRAKWIQPTPSHFITLRSILILSNRAAWSSSNAWWSYSWSVWFESSLRHQLSWGISWFPSLSPLKCGNSTFTRENEASAENQVRKPEYRLEISKGSWQGVVHILLHKTREIDFKTLNWKYIYVVYVWSHSYYKYFCVHFNILFSIIRVITWVYIRCSDCR